MLLQSKSKKNYQIGGKFIDRGVKVFQLYKVEIDSIKFNVVKKQSKQTIEL